MATLYHYTSLDALARIANDRALKPFLYPGDKRRPPAVYCLAKDLGTPWVVETYAPVSPRADKRLVRFTIRVPVEDAHMYGYDRSKFDAEEWRMVTLLRGVWRPIPEAEWLSVTKRAHPGARWQPVPIPIPLERAAP